MVKHYNPTIVEDAARLLNSKQGDFIATEVNPVLQPVIQIQRKCNVVRRGTASNATTALLYLTPSDKDFYLTACTLSVIKDANATSINSYINVTVDGVYRECIAIAGITLTAQSETISISFPIPIKVDRGTNIYVNNTTNVATVTTSGCIVGYTVETTKGV